MNRPVRCSLIYKKSYNYFQPGHFDKTTANFFLKSFSRNSDIEMSYYPCDNSFDVKKLSTENKELYGSVNPTEISKILFESLKVELNPSVIQPIKEIKSLGTFKVKLNLHSEIQSEISIKVVPEENSK